MLLKNLQKRKQKDRKKKRKRKNSNHYNNNINKIKRKWDNGLKNQEIYKFYSHS